MKSHIFVAVLVWLWQAAHVTLGLVYNTSGPSCGVSHPPPNSPLPYCAPNTSATLEDAQAQAWRYAPVVHFHPLEPYYLQDIDVWYNASELYLTDLLTYGNSSYDFMFDTPLNEILLGPRTFISLLNSTKLTTEEKNRLIAGAPFDANNHSTAKVFYTVYDYDDAFWMYSFNLYYSWNGCSNQAIALSINGSTTVSNYIMCPPGVHESDIEHVSVLVCKSDQQVKRIMYSQHNWVEVRDCTIPNDCPFDPETGNPVTYAGLEGHANYPEENPLMVYMVVSGDAAGFVTLNNLGGVYIADRAIADPYKKWVPSPDNVVYIPPPQVIFDQNMTEFEWALYGGNWGAPLQNPTATLTCISENQTYLYDCPNDTAIQATQQALKLLKVLPIAASTEFVGSGEGYSITAVSNTSVVGYPGIPGPLTRGYSYSWMGNRSSPIHQQNTTTLTCPADIHLESTIPVTGAVDFNSSVSTISDYIIGIVVGGILLSLLLVLVLTLPILLDKSTKVQNMAVRQFSKTWRFAFGHSKQKKVNAVKGSLVGKGGGEEGEEEENAEKGIVANDTALPPIPSLDPKPSMEILPDVGPDMTDMKAVPSAASTQVFEVEMQPLEHERMRNIIWLLLGVGLFVSGIVLASIGMDSLVNNSIVSAALDELHVGSTASTVLVILIVLLALVAAADILVIFIVVLMRRSTLRLWKWEFSNPVGNLPWCVRHSFELHVIAVGIVTLILTKSCLLFALAFGVTIVQLGARILCKKAFNVRIFGNSAQDVCITVPFITENQICGWQVMEFCGEVTNMEVRLLMLGAALLLWSHVIWLTSLTAALEGQRDHRVVWHPNHDADGK